MNLQIRKRPSKTEIFRWALTLYPKGILKGISKMWSGCNQFYKGKICGNNAFCGGRDDQGLSQFFCKECWSEEADRECGTMAISGICEAEGCNSTASTNTIYLASDGIWRYICFACVLKRVGLRFFKDVSRGRRKELIERKKRKMDSVVREASQETVREAIQCQECLEDIDVSEGDSSPICPSCREDPMSFISLAKFGRYFELPK